MVVSNRSIPRRRFGRLPAAASLLTSAAPAMAQLPANRPLSRVAFGSCADQNDPQPIWSAINAYRPELFIFMGDNVYGGMRTHDLAELQAAYAKGRELQDYMAFIQKVPV